MLMQNANNAYRLNASMGNAVSIINNLHKQGNKIYGSSDEISRASIDFKGGIVKSPPYDEKGSFLCLRF